MFYIQHIKPVATIANVCSYSKTMTYKIYFSVARKQEADYLQLGHF